MILAGCAKDPCRIEKTVPIEFRSIDSDKIWSINLHFQQGERVVMADIVHGFDFKDGVFKWVYVFDDTDPDLLVWRVYSDRNNWVEYRTIIK